jgi:hypothetical protein
MESLQIGKEKSPGAKEAAEKVSAEQESNTSGAKALIVGRLYGPAEAVP